MCTSDWSMFLWAFHGTPCFMHYHNSKVHRRKQVAMPAGDSCKATHKSRIRVRFRHTAVISKSVSDHITAWQHFFLASSKPQQQYWSVWKPPWCMKNPLLWVPRYREGAGSTHHWTYGACTMSEAMVKLNEPPLSRLDGSGDRVALKSLKICMARCLVCM